MTVDYLNSELQVEAEKLSESFRARPEVARQVASVTDEATLQEFSTILEAEMSKRDHKRSARFLEVCATASSFLRTYVGIAEMVKAVDQTAGGLAYGSVSFLLMLASEKRALEHLILDSLEEVCRLIKHMACVQQFLPGRTQSEQLHHYGLAVHCKMLRVLGIVIDYASMPWYSRLKWVITKPQKKDIAAGMKALEAAMSSFRDIVLADASKRIQGLEHQLADQVQMTRKSRLLDLQRALQCSGAMDPVEALEVTRRHDNYRRFNDGDSGDHTLSREVQQFYETRYQHLTQTDYFQSWSQSKRGCFLVLEATNLHQTAIDPRQPVWLSPALAQYASVQKEHRTKVIYYRAAQSRLPASRILSVIITSILSWDDEFCDRHQDSVNTALVSAATDIPTIMSQAKILLRQWLDEHPSDRITIIFDRIELCLGEGSDAEAQMAGLRSIFDGLAELIMDQDRLRLCVTVNKSAWPHRMAERFRYFQDSKAKGCFVNPGQLYEVEEPSW